ncbi:MAG: hypothetical protein KMY54_00615 [Erysipelothrix sp.]|nr:hypothetical protein [Erysipelothrix sp.]
MKRIEQIKVNGEYILDDDVILSRNEIFHKLKSIFPKIEKDGKYYIFSVGKFKFSIRIKNISYLGHPHLPYKKRIQIPDDLDEFYSYSKINGYIPLLLGIYSFENRFLLVEFNIENYIDNKHHNSSAHVWTEDLLNGYNEKIFQKTDYKKNRVTVIDPEYFVRFLEIHYMSGDNIDFDYSLISTPKVKQETLGRDISDIIEIFNSYIGSLTKLTHGLAAYQEMISEEYNNAYQAEWLGFYLEFKFRKYLKENNLEEVITFVDDKSKNGVDLDLYFNKMECFADMKSHSITSRSVLGNDFNVVKSVVEKYGVLYYIVFEHNTILDSFCGYEVTSFWNQALNKKDLMSYSSKMKNSANLIGYRLLEINSENFTELEIFRQGINSNGKLREPKIMIKKDKFPIFEIHKKSI